MTTVAVATNKFGESVVYGDLNKAIEAYTADGFVIHDYLNTKSDLSAGGVEMHKATTSDPMTILLDPAYRDDVVIILEHEVH